MNKKPKMILYSILCSLITNVDGYIMLSNKVNFSQAQTNCEAIGGALASIHSHDDLVEVQALCDSDVLNSLCWIGGQHNAPANGDCTYSWIDGSEWDYNPPRYNIDPLDSEYCTSSEPYTCLTTPQDPRYLSNTLHDCYDMELRPICSNS